MTYQREETDMHRVASKARRLIPGALLTTLAALPAQAAWQLNMTQGVTSTAQEAYDLHMLVLWICTIVGVAVFAVMIYAIVTFQKAKGATPATFTHSTRAEVIWTVIPTLILVSVRPTRGACVAQAGGPTGSSSAVAGGSRVRRRPSRGGAGSPAR